MQRVGGVAVGLAFALGLAPWLGPAPSSAARTGPGQGPIEIRAHSLEYERERELYQAQGDVRIVQDRGRGGKARWLEADWVLVSGRTRHGVASGNVALFDGKRTLRADFMEFDIDSLTGFVFEGRFEAGQFRIWARRMNKTGPDTYQLRRGGFTTCHCPEGEREPWRIRARNADIEVGGYGTVRNASLDILGVPVIWLPWMIYPIKTERQSGLLFPEIGVGGGNGFQLGLPLFWAAGDPVNVTLTPRYLSERGFKQDLDLEYVVGERSAGSLSVSYLHDRKVGRRDLAINPDRWAVRFRSDSFLPAGWRVRSEIDLVSDNLYLSDFEEFALRRRDRFLESRLWAGNHFGADGRAGLQAGLVYADDLQNPDDADRDQFLLQRVPSVSFDWLPAPLAAGSGFVAALDADYVYFRPQRSPREALRANPVVGADRFLDTGIDGLPDIMEGNEATRTANAALPIPLDIHGDNVGPEGDGRFQEGEPLADRGHRMTLHPLLARPLRLAAGVELVPELGYRATLYSSRAQGFEERGVITARVDLRARLQRAFGDGGRLRHRLEPRLSWVLARARGQRGDPVFVPEGLIPQRRIRQLALDAVTRDPSDRVSDANSVVLGFGNRIYDGRRLLADFTISADWDFERRRLGHIVLDGSSFHVGRANTRFDLVVDPRERRVDEALFDASWRIAGRSQQGLRYRFLRRAPQFFEAFRGQERERFKDFDRDFDRVHQLDFRTRIALGRNFTLNYNLSYAIDAKLLLANRGALEYTSKCRCWAIQLEVSTDRSRGVRYALRYQILGLGDDRGSPFAGGRPRRGLFGLP